MQTPLKPNTLKPSEEEDDITKWHELLALVQENKTTQPKTQTSERRNNFE